MTRDLPWGRLEDGHPNASFPGLQIFPVFVNTCTGWLEAHPTRTGKQPWKLPTSFYKKSLPGLAFLAPIKVILGPHYFHNNPTHCQSLQHKAGLLCIAPGGPILRKGRKSQSIP